MGRQGGNKGGRQQKQNTATGDRDRKNKAQAESRSRIIRLHYCACIFLRFCWDCKALNLDGRLHFLVAVGCAKKGSLQVLIEVLKFISGDSQQQAAKVITTV